MAVGWALSRMCSAARRAIPPQPALPRRASASRAPPAVSCATRRSTTPISLPFPRACVRAPCVRCVHVRRGVRSGGGVRARRCGGACREMGPCAAHAGRGLVCPLLVLWAPPLTYPTRIHFTPFLPPTTAPPIRRSRCWLALGSRWARSRWARAGLALGLARCACARRALGAGWGARARWGSRVVHMAVSVVFRRT